MKHFITFDKTKAPALNKGDVIRLTYHHSKTNRLIGRTFRVEQHYWYSGTKPILMLDRVYVLGIPIIAKIHFPLERVEILEVKR